MITLAKSAGFCFGVSRAMELVEQAASGEGKVVTLGPIIHNRHAVSYLQQLGVGVIVSPTEAQPGDTVLMSPACAAFDQFKNFMERGNYYKQLIKEL